MGTADFCVKHVLECPAEYTQLNVEQLLCLLLLCEMKKMLGAHIPSPSSEMSHDQSYWLGKQSVYRGVCIVQTHVYHSLVAHVQVSDVSDVYFLLCVSSECDHIGLVWAQ